MRGGYPVRAVRVEQVKTNTVTGKVVSVRSWWRVDAGMIGNCGHKHRTRELAEKCLEPMTLRYREARWPGSVKTGKRHGQHELK